jgi:signal peptidase II
VPTTPDRSDEPALTTSASEPPSDLPGTDAAAAAPHRRGLVVLLVAVMLVVLAVDQLSKAWALRSLDGTRDEILGEWLGLQLVHNPGAALGIGNGMTWVLTLVAIGVVVVVVRVARRLGSTLWALSLGLLLGGALGNLMDRLFREPGLARGRVIDFIAYADWFVGNVADIAIVVAAGLIVIAGARGERVDGTRETHDERDATDEARAPETASTETVSTETASTETASSDTDTDTHTDTHMDAGPVPARREDGAAGA